MKPQSLELHPVPIVCADTNTCTGKGTCQVHTHTEAPLIFTTMNNINMQYSSIIWLLHVAFSALVISHRNGTTNTNTTEQVPFMI